jgi:hypothetical protein
MNLIVRIKKLSKKVWGKVLPTLDDVGMIILIILLVIFSILPSIIYYIVKFVPFVIEIFPRSFSSKELRRFFEELKEFELDVFGGSP